VFIGRYRVVRRLGGGGMGNVYLAHDPQLNDRPVAVKVPRFDGPLEVRESLLRRFLQEASAAASVPHHAHVCPVYDHGESDGQPYLVMARLKGRGRFEDVREAVRLVRQSAEGLAALHAAGVIHRDLKPGNILLDHDGRPLLSDFGLARLAGGSGLTGPGAILGTPEYMAPEQTEVGASEVAEAADVYGLGAVLYHLLTGRKPYEGDIYQVLRRMSATGPPPASSLRAGLDAGLEGVLRRMMDRQPENRPSAPQAVNMLADWLAGSTAPRPQPPTLPDGTTPVVPEPVPRRRRLAAAMLLAVALVAGGLTAWLRTGPAAAPPPVAPRGEMAYQGSVDVCVWDDKHSERRRLRLNEPGALPLRAGDLVRVEAEVHPSAYLYAVVIDPAGRAQPLYPWKPGQWDSRPNEETPVGHLNLPQAADEGWRVSPGPAGMETVVLLARPKPLTVAEEAQLMAALAGLGPLKEQTPRSVVWFENGEEVKNDAAQRAWEFDTGKIEDPVLRTQALMRDKLGPLFPYTRAVSYANAGK
jgi:hypothetical protein